MDSSICQWNLDSGFKSLVGFWRAKVWRAKVALGQDKTKKNYHFKLCMSFVCLVPVRLLLSSVAVLYHVNG